MRTTVRLPDDLYRALRMRAAESGRTMAAVLVAALRRGLDGDRKPGSPHGAAMTSPHVREAAAPYEGDAGEYALDDDGSLRIPSRLIQQAGLGAESPLRVRVGERCLLIEPAYPLTEELAGSLRGMWKADPVDLQRSLREESER